MKITSVRTRVVEWRGKTVPLPPHFCTNPMDILQVHPSSMSTFTLPRLARLRNRNRRQHHRHRQRRPLPSGHQASHRPLPQTPPPRPPDPWDTEFLWQHMYRKTVAFGRKGIGMAAISAVDIALWDILGKSAKQPVYRLLGGRTKPKIPVYASRLYATPLDELSREATRYKNEGYRAQQKMQRLQLGTRRRPRRNGKKYRPRQNTPRNRRPLKSTSAADAYMGWSLDYAKRILPRLEPFNLRWLEEPVLPDECRGYAQLKSLARIPIAGGRRTNTPLQGFRNLIENNCLDVIQFDTNRVGGITQAKKISALAEAYSIPVVPHAGQMHNYHVVMASLNCPMAEFFPPTDVEVGNELFWHIFDGEPTPKDGFIDLDPNKPGLGLTLNESALQKFHVTE